MSLREKLTHPEFILNSTVDLIATHEADGTILFVNETYLNITGYSREELIGHNPYNFFHPHDQETIKEHGHIPSLEGSNSSLVEYRFICKDGRYIWLQTQTQPIVEGGEVVGLVTTSREVTEGIKARNSMGVVTDMMDQSSEMASMGAWEVTLNPFKIKWSKTVYDIHEMDYSVEPGLVDALEFYIDGGKEKLGKHFDDLLKNGVPYDLELRFKSAAGTLKWVRAIGKAVYRNGEIYRLHGVLQDITRTVEDRLRLRELADFLTRQKLQMEQFNQIVSHNLRSPIANLGILLNYYEESEDPKEKAQFIEYLKDSSNSLQELLNDLVDAVKILNDKEIPQEPVDIQKLLNKVKRILSLEISNAHALVSMNTMEWTSVDYAPIYLESILMNLISNAIKYAHEDRHPRIEISTRKKGREKLLIVSDNGMGINMDRHAEKLFKLHKTFARGKSGKGLGLFMTKQQIEAMGGEIMVESELGVGTTFTINLNKYRL